MKLGPEQNVQMPMKTVISLIIMVSLGPMGYFQIQEKLNQHDTLLQMHTKEKEKSGTCCQTKDEEEKTEEPNE